MSMKTNDISAIDCAYVAGLLDADGWIGLHGCKPASASTGLRARGGNFRIHYTHLVGIVNRSVSTLEWVQSIFGGKIRARNMDRMAPHAKRWSQTYDWVALSSNVDDFLAAIYPYLRIKKRQAEIVMEIRKTMLRRGVQQQHSRTQEVTDFQNKLYMEIRALNKTGKESVQ